MKAEQEPLPFFHSPLPARTNYRQARAWLAARPNFELRTTTEQQAAMLLLERPRALLRRLGRPDRAYKIFLVAGTKGKGSTAVFLASVLRAHGLRVGLYTQPHLHSFRERLRINGRLISRQELAAEVQRIQPLVEAIETEQPELGPLTAYEVTTALGLSWFARREVDWAVLEVGLGGRLDATNVVSPAVSVITPISYDHTHILGKTLPLIAAEKAGIIKPGGRVVSAFQRPVVTRVIRRVSDQRGARLTVVTSPDIPGMELKVRYLTIDADRADLPLPFFTADLLTPLSKYNRIELYLGGMHQIINARTALTALEAAEEHGLRLKRSAVRRGFRAARWPGRFEVVRTAPLLVLDGAHNAESALFLRRSLDLHFRYDLLHLVLGVFSDKDLNGILRGLLPADSLTAIALDNPRARPAEQIARAARRLGTKATNSPDVGSAIDSLVREAAPRDLICVTGSLALVAAAREALGLARHEREP